MVLSFSVIALVLPVLVNLHTFRVFVYPIISEPLNESCRNALLRKLYFLQTRKSIPKFVNPIPKLVIYNTQKMSSKGQKISMNRQTGTPADLEQWRINLKDLKNRTGMSTKLIADKENLSEKSVARVFSGEAKNPGVDLVRRIIHSLGGTWSEIFAESGAVIGSQDLATLQAEVNRLSEENAVLASNLNISNLDNVVLRDKVAALESENKLLCLKLEYEEKLVAVHNFYNKLNSNI